MDPVVKVVVATHVKTGRWVTVATFGESRGQHAADYARDVAQRCRSHTNFEVLEMSWEAAKEECARRNAQLFPKGAP